jgi:CBS domain-containing protein
METLLKEILGKKGAVVHQVASSMTVRDAVRLMNNKTIGSLLVADGEQIVGIFTERDVLTRVIDAGRDPEQTTVAEVMTRSPQCVEETVTLQQAMSIMRQRRFRHLPITNREGAVIGMLSIGDLIAWLAEDQEQEIEKLVNYIAGSY